MCQGWILTLELIPGHDEFWRGTFRCCCWTKLLHSQVSYVDQNTLISWHSTPLPLFSAWTAPFQIQITPTVFPVPRITSLLVNTCPAKGSKWSSGATSGPEGCQGTDRPSWGHSPEDPATMKVPPSRVLPGVQTQVLEVSAYRREGRPLHRLMNSLQAHLHHHLSLGTSPHAPPGTRASFGSSSILASISGHLPMPSSAPPFTDLAYSSFGSSWNAVSSRMLPDYMNQVPAAPTPPLATLSPFWIIHSWNILYSSFAALTVMQIN